MPAMPRQQHTDRPGLDELVIRYRLIRRHRRPDMGDAADVPCAYTDPEAFFTPFSSPVQHSPTRDERIALAICGECPIQDLCLLRDMQVETVFEIRGVRAGLRQSERRGLYRALDRQGER